LHAQIALSLVMGKLVELTGLTHYYIIVACLGTRQQTVFLPSEYQMFRIRIHFIISCGSLCTLVADSGNSLRFFIRFLTKIKVFFTGLERLLTFL
jgi:hypothetical protein